MCQAGSQEDKRTVLSPGEQEGAGLQSPELPACQRMCLGYDRKEATFHPNIFFRVPRFQAVGPAKKLFWSEADLPSALPDWSAPLVGVLAHTHALRILLTGFRIPQVGPSVRLAWRLLSEL